MLYKDGMEWKPVETQDVYGTALNRFNRVTFKPIETQALRLELMLQPDYSGRYRRVARPVILVLTYHC